MNSKSQKSCHRSGFTIIELLIAIGLFGIITNIAVGGLVRALRTQTQLVNLLMANSNMSLVLEQMSREIRTGFDFCTNGTICPLGAPKRELSFRNGKNERVTYCLVGESIARQVGSEPCENGSPILTAENIAVKYLNFFVEGNRVGDVTQPRVTIALGVGFSKGQGSGSPLSIQTTISARPADIE